MYEINQRFYLQSTVYTSPIAMITRSFQVCHQQYADDTQLFISLNPSDPSSDITNLTSCLRTLIIHLLTYLLTYRTSA